MSSLVQLCASFSLVSRILRGEAPRVPGLVEIIDTDQNRNSLGIRVQCSAVDRLGHQGIQAIGVQVSLSRRSGQRRT